MVVAFRAELDKRIQAWNKETHEPGEITPQEEFWIEHQRWLESCGYMLRPRYHPDWIPSWKSSKKKSYTFEDGQILPPTLAGLMDAKRISDGKLVKLKRVFKPEHPFEAEIGLYFSSPALKDDPHNHCIPILDILEVPDVDDLVLLVMPLLRPYNNPSFVTIGETVDFLKQILQVSATRDCTGVNILMDPKDMYPQGYHPMSILRNWEKDTFAKHRTRTECPPRYYLADFGLSRKYDPNDEPVLDYPIRGADKSVPEFQDEGSFERSDPFATDIYYLGNMIREDFINRYFGLAFIRPLVENMIKKDPSARPSIDQVIQQFQASCESLTKNWFEEEKDFQKNYGRISAINCYV
ncbi:hypothetical protein Clacol_008939 [Clathrus columnatus]|uniref:Protein kinase domain-containing protein n=1 Tax=Clathrus columnatus TaxID=1419009 RepID=A0AAV5AME9_9AGAM|nr:hypothetical protein Clacol_008939 [Clathrus columnatus]